METMIDSMKRLLHVALIVLCVVCPVACSDDEGPALPAITVTSSVENVVLPASKNFQFGIEFQASSQWKAETDVEWATVSPRSGNAGQVKVSLITKEANNTGLDRSGTLTLTGADGKAVQVAFTQTTSEVLLLKQANFEVPCEGQDLALEFATNVEGRFKLMVYSDVSSWITSADNGQTRSLVEDAFYIRVLPNKTRDAREATFQIYVVDAENTDNVLMQSEKIYIRQAGEPVETSSDYSADKRVRTLLTHSKGNGIPVVLLGDGFVDREITEGYYDEVMDKAMENLFTEEPLHSLREYFDVWAVTAVSKNNAFGDGYSTVFGSVLEGNGSSGIVGSSEKVLEYASVIDELQDVKKMEETLVVVLLNTSVYAGTTAIGYKLNGDEMSEFAIGYCPVIENLDSDTFRRVLCHECIGHGLAKLLDEYSYEGMGEIPLTLVSDYRTFQSYGWAMNVSFTGDADQTPWAHFLQDSRYQETDAFGETLGVYEGACTYWTGAWRPTEESMMRSNIHGFNVPSREAIYKRVMSAAYGDAWTYDYETFVQFDQAHLPQPAATRADVGAAKLKPLPAPRFINRTFWLK